MTEREVVARRAGSVRAVYLIAALVGVALLALSAAFLANAGGEPWLIVAWVIFLVAGVLVAVLGVRYFVKAMRTPEIICEREGDRIVFLGEQIPLKDLLNVRCRRAHSRYGAYRWGSLTVEYAGGSVKCDFVAEVENVHDRLIALLREYAGEGKGE